ncbi:hypothetical protein [Streptomyces lonarensis]|uniref:hypothetical protein n=1 Tax=Streptomyces lonarensis TaxID=700599 RepID=UPI0028B21F6A|nr:hypothetical protein [Streptomyces lonarensis]
MSKEDQVADLKFSAAQGESIEVCFEPVGTTFSLSDGEAVFLRTAISNVASFEIVSWPNGVGVWVPYPGDYAIVDSQGNEIDTL